jgi:hypothetical protein
MLLLNNSLVHQLVITHIYIYIYIYKTYAICYNYVCVQVLPSRSKGKVYPITGNGGSEVEMYSSTLSLTSALDGVGSQSQAPAALPPPR